MTPKEVRAARQKLGLNQTEFGEKLGLTQNFVSMLERGVKPISKRTELAIKYLLSEQEKKQ